ncbi:MAG: FkbM family methyltransferase [Gammaproteobacteria bacterium]|nr:FkbM family methyltransferase [Pseudomonadales bacterium]MCP5346140.1 FkbM family methyltransferase [Pseudomonadales bacterium]
MNHFLRKQLLSLIQKSPFEEAIRDLSLRFSGSRGAAYDLMTFEILKRCLRRDSNCIDVGAYRGDILRRMLKYAPDGIITAIEPVRENFDYLVKKYPAIRVCNLALSDTTGTQTFYHVLGRPARSGLQKQDYPDPNETVRETEVAIDTLDNLIPQLQQVDFIKIDVEGAELNVLRGGLALIKRCNPVIVFEHSEQDSRKFAVTSEQLRLFLMDDCQLQISTLTGWLAGDPSLSPEGFHQARQQQGEFYFIAH